MTNLSRREALKCGLYFTVAAWADSMAAGCSLLEDGSKSDSSGAPLAPSGRPLVEPLMDERTPILWVETATCTGCSVALLTGDQQPIESILGSLRLEFQETLMDASGTSAVDHLFQMSHEFAHRYILIVDGAIPLGASEGMTTVGLGTDGAEMTAQALVGSLSESAAAVVSLGTCASFGGIPAAAPNLGGYGSIASLVAPAVPFIRLPGCPPHPSVVAECLLAALMQGPQTLTLDAKNRPLPMYATTVHDQCPRRVAYDANQFAETLGDPTGCLMNLGCRGFDTFSACPSRSTVGRLGCIQANHPCIGCCSPGFPDTASEEPSDTEEPWTIYL